MPVATAAGRGDRAAPGAGDESAAHGACGLRGASPQDVDEAIARFLAPAMSQLRMELTASEERLAGNLTGALAELRRDLEGAHKEERDTRHEVVEEPWRAIQKEDEKLLSEQQDRIDSA